MNDPHPYRYALSLHAPSGKRLMGFDNAHAEVERVLKELGVPIEAIGVRRDNEISN